MNGDNNNHFSFLTVNHSLRCCILVQAIVISPWTSAREAPSCFYSSFIESLFTEKSESSFKNVRLSLSCFSVSNSFFLDLKRACFVMAFCGLASVYLSVLTSSLLLLAYHALATWMFGLFLQSTKLSSCLRAFALLSPLPGMLFYTWLPLCCQSGLSSNYFSCEVFPDCPT